MSPRILTLSPRAGKANAPENEPMSPAPGERGAARAEGQGGYPNARPNAGTFVLRAFALATTATVIVNLTGIGLLSAAEMPPGASSCSGCHPASAAVETPVPRLAAHSASDIVAAMQEFRTGKRPATVMDRIAKGLSDDEIAAIAAWYAAQH